jgi:hypothetical protein
MEGRDAHQAVQPLGLRGTDPGRLARLGRRPQLQRAILKRLAQPPPAIICDLGQVEAIDPQCAQVFTSIRHPALDWPGTALVLCGTARRSPAPSSDRGVARRLAMHPSLDQANPSSVCVGGMWMCTTIASAALARPSA